MNTTDDMAQRHGEILAELADMGMSLARHVHAQAMEAQGEQAESLALAFHRISRSVRQTLALESRLQRERRNADREIRAEQNRDFVHRVQKRRRQVRNAIAAEIWTEAEGEEAEELFENLEALLMDEANFDDDSFADSPLEACIERIRADLGLAAANDPGGAPAAPALILRRSSA